MLPQTGHLVEAIGGFACVSVDVAGDGVRRRTGVRHPTTVHEQQNVVDPLHGCVGLFVEAEREGGREGEGEEGREKERKGGRGREREGERERGRERERERDRQKEKQY